MDNEAMDNEVMYNSFAIKRVIENESYII